MAQYGYDTEANLELAKRAINEKLRREVRHNQFFSHFSGDVEVEDMANGQDDYKLSGEVVERIYDMAEKGGDHIKMPVKQLWRNNFVYGDTKAKGTGTLPNYKWFKAFINQARVVRERKEGAMSVVRTEQLLDIYEDAIPIFILPIRN